MAFGTIVSEHTRGRYLVSIPINNAYSDNLKIRLLARIEYVEGSLAQAEADLVGMEDEEQIRILTQQIEFMKLERLSLEKKIERLNSWGFPGTDSPREAWCVDLTEGMSGDVALLEVLTDVDEHINILPGYNGKPVPAVADHGTLFPFYSLPLASALQNFLLYPAIQKWRPSYRYGTLGEVDYEFNTAMVYLDFNRSRIQDLGVDHSLNLENVPIEYMQCNAGAFEEGDKVVVKFEGHNWIGPKIIGFQSFPKPCGWEEPWDGPNVTSKHLWTPYSGSLVMDSTRAIFAGPSVSDYINAAIHDGKLHITQSLIPHNVLPPNTWWWEAGWWWQYKNPSSSFILRNVKSAIVTAYGEIDCSVVRYFSHDMYFCVMGRNKTNNKFITLFFFNTYTYWFNFRHGCLDYPHIDRDWIEWYSDGDEEIHFKLITNDKVEPISFPNNYILDVETVEVGLLRFNLKKTFVGQETPKDADITPTEYVVDFLSIT